MNGEQLIKKAYDAILANDFRAALNWFELAVALEPANPSYPYKLSITALRSGYLDKALQAAESSLRLDPDNETYLQQVNRVHAFVLREQAKTCLVNMIGEPHQAVVLLRHALALDPLSAENYLLLALAYKECDDTVSALRAVRELLKLEPHHAEGIRLLRQWKPSKRKKQ